MASASSIWHHTELAASAPGQVARIEALAAGAGRRRIAALARGVLGRRDHSLGLLGRGDVRGEYAGRAEVQALADEVGGQARRAHQARQAAAPRPQDHPVDGAQVERGVLGVDDREIEPRQSHDLADVMRRRLDESAQHHLAGAHPLLAAPCSWPRR